MLGFLFPGQGSQYVGMGSDLYREFPTGRKLLSDVNRILGFPLAFYMGAQGALIIYILIIWVYAKYMNRLDMDYGVHEGED